MGIHPAQRNRKLKPVDDQPTASLTDIEVVIEEVEGEITEQMRVNRNKFWQLVISRAINSHKLKQHRAKRTTKNKKQ